MSASKRKGTWAESAVVNWLIDRGWLHAHRMPLTGNKDKGDVAGPAGVTIEVKNTKTVNLAAFLDEANAESRNAGTDYGVAVIKRRGTQDPGKWYVLMDGETFAALMKEAGR